jgi:hypothetical protein
MSKQLINRIRKTSIPKKNTMSINQLHHKDRICAILLLGRMSWCWLANAVLTLLHIAPQNILSLA